MSDALHRSPSIVKSVLRLLDRRPEADASRQRPDVVSNVREFLHLNE